MARTSRVVLNRQALGQVDLVMAAGLEAAAAEIIERVRPPDATPFGVGLVDQGGYMTWVDGKKVGGTATRKPRRLMTSRGIVVAVGFGFPGKFQEMGTVNQPPRPFLTPVVMGVVGDSSIVASAVRSALARTLGSLARVRT